MTTVSLGLVALSTESPSNQFSSSSSERAPLYDPLVPVKLFSYQLP